MAFRMDFGPTNRTLRQLQWMMGQNWLGQQSQDRRMDFLGEQESMLQRGREQGAHLTRQEGEAKFGEDMEKKFVDFVYDVAKYDKVKHATSMFQAARGLGDEAGAQRWAEVSKQEAIKAGQAISKPFANVLGNIPAENWTQVALSLGGKETADLAGKAATTEMDVRELGQRGKEHDLDVGKEKRIAKDEGKVEGKDFTKLRGFLTDLRRTEDGILDKVASAGFRKKPLDPQMVQELEAVQADIKEIQGRMREILGLGGTEAESMDPEAMALQVIERAKAEGKVVPSLEQARQLVQQRLGTQNVK